MGLHFTTGVMALLVSIHPPLPVFSNGFSDSGLGPWTPSYTWAPEGYAGGDMSSWWLNPGYAPTSAQNTDPFSVKDGMLSIGIKPTPSNVKSSDVGGRPYVSGLLQTHLSFSQRYGYFEITAKMSAAKGTMSAFWLLPASGAWPPEIDVVEVLANHPTLLATSAHTGPDTLLQGFASVPDMTAAFHTYGMDWEEQTITWYFDGQQVFQIPTPADMHQPMYMLMDVSAGTVGSWEGQPPTGQETGAMQVKAVTVYQSNPYTYIAPRRPVAVR